MEKNFIFSTKGLISYMLLTCSVINRNFNIGDKVYWYGNYYSGFLSGINTIIDITDEWIILDNQKQFSFDNKLIKLK